MPPPSPGNTPHRFSPAPTSSPAVECNKRDVNVFYVDVFWHYSRNAQQ